MVVLLTVVCGVCSLLLSGVYNATEPKIQADIARKLNVHLMEVMSPGAAEYKVFTEDTTLWTACDESGKVVGIAGFEPVIVDTLWSVADAAGNKIGIAFKVFPRGYSGLIETLIGLNMDTLITGIRTSTPAEGLRETPGLGVKVNEPCFKRQFVGKREGDVVLKKDGGQLDAITAATISSRAVTDGVKKGINNYKSYLQSESNDKEPPARSLRTLGRAGGQDSTGLSQETDE
jgi:electron transport complex protein RnfG